MEKKDEADMWAPHVSTPHQHIGMDLDPLFRLALKIRTYIENLNG
jgi:hypothetical protein